MTVGVTVHEVKVAAALKSAGDWISSEAVANSAGVAWRTAREHLVTLTAAGFAERVEMSPCYLYRWKGVSGTTVYAKALRAASRAIFGENL